MIKPEITITMTLPEYLEEVSKSKDELMKEILGLKFQLQDILEQLLKSKLEYTKNLTSFIEQNKMLLAGYVRTHIENEILRQIHNSRWMRYTQHWLKKKEFWVSNGDVWSIIPNGYYSLDMVRNLSGKHFLEKIYIEPFGVNTNHFMVRRCVEWFDELCRHKLKLDLDVLDQFDHIQDLETKQCNISGEISSKETLLFQLERIEESKTLLHINKCVSDVD